MVKSGITGTGARSISSYPRKAAEYKFRYPISSSLNGWTKASGRTQERSADRSFDWELLEQFLPIPGILTRVVFKIQVCVKSAKNLKK